MNQIIDHRLGEGLGLNETRKNLAANRTLFARISLSFVPFMRYAG